MFCACRPTSAIRTLLPFTARAMLECVSAAERESKLATAPSRQPRLLLGPPLNASAAADAPTPPAADLPPPDVRMVCTSAEQLSSSAGCQLNSGGSGLPARHARTRWRRAGAAGDSKAQRCRRVTSLLCSHWLCRLMTDGSSKQNHVAAAHRWASAWPGLAARRRTDARARPGP